MRFWFQYQRKFPRDARLLSNGLWHVERTDHLQEHIDECGTSACGAGHAVALFGWKGPGRPIKDAAAALLGLDSVQAADLFTPWNGRPPTSGKDITAEQFAATLDRLVETGEVRWA
jgi:hypothetical protein